MKRSLALLLPMTLCVAVIQTGASDAKALDLVTGKIFDPGTPFVNESFFYENTRRVNGNRAEARTIYRDREGKSLVEETTIYENGKLLRYTYDQKQVNESGEIELRDGKVHYVFRTPAKEAKDSESIEPNMIVPDMVPGVVQKNWDQLMAGEAVKTRFLVLERQDSFGFKFFKDKERELDGVPVVDFILKPSSIFIAAVAPNIRITAEKAPPHRTVEMEGVLPVRVAEVFPPKKRSDYRALDGLLKFDAAKAPAPKAKAKKR